ncbi:hypothetical protein FACS1894130_10400 [Spirochaetia bacterium]|nr:hypothetical protein FACS1894130_10400 [Spirochaetia bacterium]
MKNFFVLSVLLVVFSSLFMGCASVSKQGEELDLEQPIYLFMWYQETSDITVKSTMDYLGTLTKNDFAELQTLRASIDFVSERSLDPADFKYNIKTLGWDAYTFEVTEVVEPGANFVAIAFLTEKKYNELFGK